MVPSPTATLALGAALVLLSGRPGDASARPPERVAPGQYGQVFRANRGALVRVRPDQEGAAWSDGVVLGAEGELVFGVEPTPTPRLWVMVAGASAPRPARLLGFDRALGVAVARLEPGARVAPARADGAAELWADRWLVVLTHDNKGAPTSHAGQVMGAVRPDGLVTAEVPGRPGSPLFASDGALIAVAVRGGKRRVQARPLAGLMPVLKRVVLAGDDRGR